MNKKKRNIGRCKDCAYQMTERCFYSRAWQTCYEGIRIKRERQKMLKESSQNDISSKI